MNYATATETLATRDRKKVTHNTYLERRAPDVIALRLHATDVVTFYADGRIVLDSGGWLTVTTKDRMNYADGIRVSSQRGRWYVNGAPYFDGMVIVADPFTILNVESAPDVAADDAENRRVEKAIRRYVSLYSDDRIAALVEQGPTLGDCFFCGMQEVESGKPLGDATGDNGHLETHLEEGYVMLSTIVNAVVEKGYPSPAVILHYAPDSARRALVSYLRKRLLQGVSTR